MTNHQCPVCGYPELRDPPRSSTAGASYEICPSCGFEFGVSDDDLGYTHHQWREEWMRDGMPWRSRRPQPEDWNPSQQLEAVQTVAPTTGIDGVDGDPGASHARSGLVEVRIPASFVVDRVVLAAGEIVYGMDLGWLDPAGAVSIATAKSGRAPMGRAEETLALLLPDEYHRVPELIEQMRLEIGQGERPARVWGYLALDWLAEHRDDFEDPYSVVESICSDLGDPDELSALVRSLLSPTGGVSGADELERRWLEITESARAEFGRRNEQSSDCEA